MNPALGQHFWWYVARAGGLVAWWTVSASVVWGMLLSTRLIRRRGLPAWLLDLHRFLGGLSVVFVAMHVAGLVADSYVHFGPSEVLVPLASRWHPVAVAWGVVGVYLLAAIEVTSLSMRRLPRRWWRGVHLTSFALFVLIAAHALSAGTDQGNLAVRCSALVIGAAFVFLVVFRQLGDRADSGPTRVPVAGRAGGARARLPARQQDAVAAGEVAAHVDRREARRVREVDDHPGLVGRDLHDQDARSGEPSRRLLDDPLDVLDA